MKYHEWKDTLGEYRWYNKEGEARVILPLDYNWVNVYNIVTDECDLHFHNYDIPCDAHDFTDYFFSYIPTAWFKYKTMFEMYTGTLDGTTIDPQMFEAGFTRDTEATTDSTETLDGNEKINVENNVNNVENSNVTDNIGAYTDTHTSSSNSLGRALTYLQGVQGIENINNGNIGLLGNKYASSIVDNVNQTDTMATDNGGERSNQSTQNGNSQGTQRGEQLKDTDNTTTGNTTFREHIHETRINYYDNLAFLRDRIDRINQITPFYSYFEQFFSCVKAMSKKW